MQHCSNFLNESSIHTQHLNLFLKKRRSGSSDAGMSKIHIMTNVNQLLNARFTQRASLSPLEYFFGAGNTCIGMALWIMISPLSLQREFQIIHNTLNVGRFTLSFPSTCDNNIKSIYLQANLQKSM